MSANFPCLTLAVPENRRKQQPSGRRTLGANDTERLAKISTELRNTAVLLKHVREITVQLGELLVECPSQPVQLRLRRHEAQPPELVRMERFLRELRILTVRKNLIETLDSRMALPPPELRLALDRVLTILSPQPVLHRQLRVRPE